MNNKGFATFAIVLIIIAVIGGILVIANWDKISEVITPGTNEAGISVTYYDENGNIITPSTLSTITAPGGNPTPGVKYIALTTTVLNTGTLPLSCFIVSATPTIFDSALVKTAKVVPSTGSKKASWTSNAFDITSLEGGASPDPFTVTVRCSYNAGTDVVYLTDQAYSLSLTIVTDGTGSFTVNIESPGGLGTEYCGNGACESSLGETTTTCPQDCASTANAKFRTSDSVYVSGSAIAYGTACGSALTAYGHSTVSGLLSGTCAAKMATETTTCGTSPAKLFDLPSTTGLLSGGAVPSLWKPTEANTLCVCDDSGTTYKVVKYLTTDSDASKVSTLAQSFDTVREVIC